MLLADNKVKGSHPFPDMAAFSASHHYIRHCYRDAAQTLSKWLQLLSIHMESNWKVRRKRRRI